MRSARQGPSPGRPASLTVERIVDAAVACIGRSRLDSLTMRAVAAEVGASPMSLYRHVTDRDELVALAVDRILGQAQLPADPVRPGEHGPWLVAMAHEIREILLGYPGVAEHLLVLGPTGERGFAVMDRICSVLREACGDDERAAFAYTWLMVTVAAYAARHIRARELADGAGIDLPELRDVFVRRTAPYAGRFPHLTAVAGSFTDDPARSYTYAIERVVATITDSR